MHNACKCVIVLVSSTTIHISMPGRVESFMWLLAVVRVVLGSHVILGVVVVWPSLGEPHLLSIFLCRGVWGSVGLVVIVCLSSWICRISLLCDVCGGGGSIAVCWCYGVTLC